MLFCRLKGTSCSMSHCVRPQTGATAGGAAGIDCRLPPALASWGCGGKTSVLLPPMEASAGPSLRRRKDPLPSLLTIPAPAALLPALMPLGSRLLGRGRPGMLPVGGLHAGGNVASAWHR
jgi:hypothetical protein